MATLDPPAVPSHESRPGLQVVGAPAPAPDFLSIDRLWKGLLVEYLGETTTDDLVVGLGYPPPVCDRLWHGHPGVIREPQPQHVQVTWAGLEDTVQSFGMGHSCDDSGEYGLGVITAADYEKRRRRVLTGQAPQE